MASHFYMSLPGIGNWQNAMSESGAQFAPYRSFLTTAKNAADKRAFSLTWREPTPEELKEINRRWDEETAQTKSRAQNAQRRRDRHIQTKNVSGEWIILEPRPECGEEPETTFDAFLEAKDIYERPPSSSGKSMRWRTDSKIDVLGIDREALALMLSRLPDIPEADDEADTDDGEVTALIYLKPNTWSLECQQRSLETLENRPSPRLSPLLRLVSTRPTWGEVHPESILDSNWVFLRRERDGSMRDGTPEQRDFVRRALATPDFAVLEGPPGSGKTTAICELIVQLARAGKRVLLVASTHVAVDNVLERLIEWQDEADEKLVMPIRIGDENSVTTPAIKPWVLRNLLRTWNSEILDHLDHPGDAKPEGATARKLLKEALSHKSEESAFSRMILDASNLVCGTTIGILQHPAIKATRSKQRNDSDARNVDPFDFLILDEASKTTFTEFLVPAIFAKRWVVVGDRRQLSPYVEEQDLAENLRGLLSPARAYAVAHTFLASSAISQGMRQSSLVAVSSDEESYCFEEEAEARNVAAVDLDLLEPQKECRELLFADLVYGNAEAIAACEHRLPGDIVVTSGKLPELSDWEAHRRACNTKINLEPVTWADEVAWRQVRAYELRNNLPEQKRYLHELRELLPKCLQDNELAGSRRPRTLRDGQTQSPIDVLEEDLEHMRRVAMASILEILQVGAGSLGWEMSTALTHGLPDAALEERLVSLSFQHRMHPDISALPREQFYSESSLLNDASGVRADREWTYPRYARRAVWLDIAPPRKNSGGPAVGNRNPAEADAVMAELKEFVHWASSAPRPGKHSNAPWEVAVLTFYKAQEKELRLRLQKESGQRGSTRNFYLGKGRVHVTLCTADRFQGHEADLVLLSFVKSGTVGFLNSPNRLNVALTRARFQLVLIGHRGWMASSRCRSDLLRTLATSPLYAKDLGWEKS